MQRPCLVGWMWNVSQQGVPHDKMDKHRHFLITWQQTLTAFPLGSTFYVNNLSTDKALEVMQWHMPVTRAQMQITGC